MKQMTDIPFPPESTPTIAVIIPNKNDSSYISKCLDSVFNQAIRPEEVIIVDDGSTDNSVEIIQNRIANISGTKLIRNANSIGAMGAANKGLLSASSEYVVFLASNDYFVDGFIAKAKASIARIGRPGVWSAMVWAVDEGGKLLHLYPSAVVSRQEAYIPPTDCIKYANLLGNWFTGTTLLYRRDILQQIGGFDVDYFGLGDLFAALTISSLGGAGFCPQPLGVMRVHSGGYLSRTLTDQNIFIPILNSFEQKGEKLSPELFSRKFCDRTARRFIFASFRALKANQLNDATARFIGSYAYRLLRITLKLLPASFVRIKLSIAYLALRPYDILPMMWYRFVGATLVRFNSKPGKL